VEAIEEVELWVVAGKILMEELGLDSWMGAFVSSLGQRFSERSNAVTRLQGEMVRERLLREVLLILTRHGKRDRQGTLRIPWRRVRRQVCQAAGCGEADLRTVVEGAPFLELRLDLARPELRLRAG
jgi:hypothetical protein